MITGKAKGRVGEGTLGKEGWLATGGLACAINGRRGHGCASGSGPADFE